MQQYEDRIALIDPINNLQYTYKDVRTLSIRFALEMRARGICKGDIISVCARNHINTVIPILAAVYLGVTVNPLHPNYSENELVRMINITEPRMIICDEQVELTIRKIRFQLGMTTQIVTFENDFETFVRVDDNEKGNFQAEDVDVENDDIFIMCTSGTTGLIKGVPVKHKAYYITLVEYNDIMEHSDIVLMYSPFCWITGIWNMGMTIFVGATKVSCDFDATKHVKILHDYQITWTMFNPGVLTTMVNNPLFTTTSKIADNLKCLLFGGSKVANEQFLEYQKYFPNTFILNAYGSTEMHFAHAYFSRKYDYEISKTKINSSGFPAPGVYWKIVDNETNELVGRNRKGELWIKGPTLTKGYYKDPAATKNVIDQDGFYHTGDLVTVDEDNCLYVVGRLKEILKYKGWQISPSELEQLISGHPAVQQVCIMGKSHETDGDLPVAFIVKKSNYDDVTEIDIVNYVDEHGSDPQKLRGGVHFLQSMPMTVSGKIKKSELAKLILDI